MKLLCKNSHVYGDYRLYMVYGENSEKENCIFFPRKKKLLKICTDINGQKKRITTVQSRQWSDESAVVAGSAEISELP